DAFAPVALKSQVPDLPVCSTGSDHHLLAVTTHVVEPIWPVVPEDWLARCLHQQLDAICALHRCQELSLSPLDGAHDSSTKTSETWDRHSMSNFRRARATASSWRLSLGCRRGGTSAEPFEGVSRELPMSA